ncbi:MAG: DUF4232 domain-containing protein [Actinomycetota bacterium]|nr:DUF4232 domain-containing protein [Actinomycetota bacterium]
MRMTTRAVIAAAAIACSAAAAAPALAAQASVARGTAAVSAARHHAPPHCASYNTTTWFGLGLGGGAAGTIYYPIEFSNTGHRACTMYGFPGVWAVTNSGRTIGYPATHQGRPRLVTLRPGQTAHAILGIVEAGNIAGCRIAHNAYLKIYAPHQRAATRIPAFTFDACWNRSVLRVGPVRPGTGIPGYTTS